jgi:hypothetical protein
MVEFTIPSICYVLGMILFVGIAFLLESKMTPYMLAILSGIILFFAARDNYSRFEASEYRAQTWTDHLKAAGPYYLFSCVIVIALVVYIVSSTSLGISITSGLGFAAAASTAAAATAEPAAAAAAPSSARRRS